MQELPFVEPQTGLEESFELGSAQAGVLTLALAAGSRRLNYFPALASAGPVRLDAGQDAL